MKEKQDNTGSEDECPSSRIMASFISKEVAGFMKSSIMSRGLANSG
jgi:hypothetical protein